MAVRSGRPAAGRRVAPLIAAHAAALAWLLDPQGLHGLGDALLRRLLQRVGLPGGSVQLPVTQVLEEDGGTAFVDLLRGSTDSTLVIEVKLDAGEQPLQAEWLWSDWQGAVAPRFRYLTPSGRAMTTYETAGVRRGAQPAAYASGEGVLRRVCRLGLEALWISATTRWCCASGGASSHCARS